MPIGILLGDEPQREACGKNRKEKKSREGDLGDWERLKALAVGAPTDDGRHHKGQKQKDKSFGIFGALLGLDFLLRQKLLVEAAVALADIGVSSRRSGAGKG